MVDGGWWMAGLRAVNLAQRPSSLDPLQTIQLQDEESESGRSGGSYQLSAHTDRTNLNHAG